MHMIFQKWITLSFGISGMAKEDMYGEDILYLKRERESTSGEKIGTDLGCEIMGCLLAGK